MPPSSVPPGTNIALLLGRLSIYLVEPVYHPGEVIEFSETDRAIGRLIKMRKLLEQIIYIDRVVGRFLELLLTECILKFSRS